MQVFVFEHPTDKRHQLYALCQLSQGVQVLLSPARRHLGISQGRAGMRAEVSGRPLWCPTRLITTSPLCSSHQCGRTGRGQPLGHRLCASKPATFPVVEGLWILQMGKQAGRCEPTQTWPGSRVEQFCGCGRPRVASPDITGRSAASHPGLPNSSLSRSGCTKSPHSCVSYPFQGRRSGPEQEPPVPYRPAMMGVSTAW